MNQLTQDSLYHLLPSIYRQRDARLGEPLRAVLQVIAEQAGDIEADIAALYDNWFIETCDDWVVPYIADLVGYRRVRAAGEPGDATNGGSRRRNNVLFPRREVANTVRLRRRKGTLPVLEELVENITPWRARAVEFAALVVRTQTLRSPAFESDESEAASPQQRRWLGGTVDFRDRARLRLLGTPFDRTARTVDLRAPQNLPGVGWHHLSNVLLFVWRRQVESVTRSQPGWQEDKGTNVRYLTFDVLGRKVPLHVKRVAEPNEESIAQPTHLPIALTRELLGRNGRAAPDYYGEGKSLCVRHCGEDVPASRVFVCNLPDETARERMHQFLKSREQSKIASPAEIAIDPELGIFVTSDCCPNPQAYHVTYHVGTAGLTGAGEAPRERSDVWTEHIRWVAPAEAKCSPGGDVLAAMRGVRAAVKFMAPENHHPERLRVQADLTIELASSSLHVLREDVVIEVLPNRTLVWRAALEHRPAIEIAPADAAARPKLRFEMHPGSRLELEGLLIAGYVEIADAPLPAPPQPNIALVPIPAADPFSCASNDVVQACGCGSATDAAAASAAPAPTSVLIRHCTIHERPPDCDCAHRGPEQDAIEFRLHSARVEIQHSVLGRLDVRSPLGGCGHGRQSVPCPVEHVQLTIEDSVIDGGTFADGSFLPVIHGGCCQCGHARATIRRSTIRGGIYVVSLPEGEDSLFLGTMQVVRRHEGYLRFCWIDPHSGGIAARTPVRFKCLPESAGVSESGNCSRSTASTAPPAELEPRFVSWNRAHPGYGQLRHDNSPLLLRGAESESEPGAFHDGFFPQRDAILRARLEEFTPSDMTSAVIYADDLSPPLRVPDG